nr:unnamed protein product [Callosobruchus analis]
MKTLGVGLVTRKMGKAVSPVVELKKEGDEYVLSSTSTFKNVVLKFKRGVEFDQGTPAGRKVYVSSFVCFGKIVLVICVWCEVTVVVRRWPLFKLNI